jgi:hypothetical protein
MGIRLQRRRSALGRTPPIKDDLSESRSVHRCGFFREAVWSGCTKDFCGAVDSAAAQARVQLAPVFAGSRCRLADTTTAKIVVGMQHPLTTFPETGRTPKKAADD